MYCIPRIRPINQVAQFGKMFGTIAKNINNNLYRERYTVNLLFNISVDGNDNLWHSYRRCC